MSLIRRGLTRPPGLTCTGARAASDNNRSGHGAGSILAIASVLATHAALPAAASAPVALLLVASLPPTAVLPPPAPAAPSGFAAGGDHLEDGGAPGHRAAGRRRG
eukprot:CAMPEP_0183512802 /NCGR_PEP_ID=MMETSP0371-20130417/11785_1 /TAXON_ID=268820 /ORGANISM="Peridinium aciculiferum, Strain PAER-2" /LENGTH=104 /DNA_ID=CAMNT_0025709923 /DNA_START=14 /DNA_END=325 /DNA_ORIENTATION=-